MIRLSIGLAAALAAAGAAAAQPGMSVTGGGLSMACADAAKKGLTCAQFETLCSSALVQQQLWGFKISHADPAAAPKATP